MEPLEITARLTAPRTTTLEIRYHTPEWAKSIEGLGTAVIVAGWSLLTGVMIIAARQGALPLPAGKTIVVVAGASAASFWLVWNANRLLQDRQRRKGITASLHVTIDANGLTREDGSGTITVPRGQEFTFTTQAHRRGRLEEREERRVGHLQGYAYRDAWEVWLQAGHRIERLAGVADEASARAIVRHLQEADQRATRGAQQQGAMSNRMAPA